MSAEELERIVVQLGQAWDYPADASRGRDTFALPQWMVARLLPGRAGRGRRHLSERTLRQYLHGRQVIPAEVAKAARSLARRARDGKLHRLPREWQRRREVAIARREDSRRARELVAQARAAGLPLPPFSPPWMRGRRAQAAHDPPTSAAGPA